MLLQWPSVFCWCLTVWNKSILTMIFGYLSISRRVKNGILFKRRLSFIDQVLYTIPCSIEAWWWETVKHVMKGGNWLWSNIYMYIICVYVTCRSMIYSMLRWPLNGCSTPSFGSAAENRRGWLRKNCRNVERRIKNVLRPRVVEKNETCDDNKTLFFGGDSPKKVGLDKNTC